MSPKVEMALWKEFAELIGLCKWPIAPEKWKDNIVPYNVNFTLRFN
jgi:hypothetical protein